RKPRVLGRIASPSSRIRTAAPYSCRGILPPVPLWPLSRPPNRPSIPRPWCRWPWMECKRWNCTFPLLRRANYPRQFGAGLLAVHSTAASGEAALHVQLARLRRRRAVRPFIPLEPVVAEVRDADVLAQTQGAGVGAVAARHVEVHGGLQVLQGTPASCRC